MGHRLLLADDSITIQKVIELTFADEKIEVVAVSDGEQAIARLANERFDIVLADLAMPVKDGFAVAAFIQGRPDLRHVPVILLTGAFDVIDDAKVSAAGAAAVLAKPFEPQLLVSRVRDLLRSAKPAAPSTGTSATPDQAGPRSIAAMPTGPEAGSSSVDEYFERLDRAFASLNAPLEPREPTRAFPQAVPPLPVDMEGSQADGELDVLVSGAASSVAFATPDSTAGRPDATGKTEAPPPQGAQSGSVGRAAADAGQTSGLAARFATLLAVEQGELPASALERPEDQADDALVDRIVRRVIEQMSDRAVRDLAAEIVSRTAERLVREEIDRIKSSA